MAMNLEEIKVIENDIVNDALEGELSDAIDKHKGALERLRSHKDNQQNILHIAGQHGFVNIFK